MAAYSFTFHECSGAFEKVGQPIELEDMEAARTHALGIARGIMSREVAHGRLCLSCWIVISVPGGQTLSTLQFGEAVEVSAPDHCLHISPDMIDPEPIDASRPAG